MTKNRTPTPVYLDPGMHPGLEVKGLTLQGFTLSDIAVNRAIKMLALDLTSRDRYDWKRSGVY